MTTLQRGQLAVVTELQSRGSAGGNVPLPPDGGGSSAFSALSAQLGHVGARIGKMADAAAAREGEAEGRIDGLDPEFRTRREGTIRADAYDAAGLDIAETRLKLGMKQQLEEAYEKHKASPKKLGEVIDAAAQGLLSGAPDELKPKLALQLGAHRLTYMREAQRELDARVRAEQIGTMQNDLASSLKTVHQQAFSLGLDPQADDAMAMQLQSLRGVLGRKGPDGKPLVAPAEQQRLLRAAEEEVNKARLYGAFDRLGTAEEKSLFIRQFEDDFKNSTGLAKVFDLGKFESIRGHLETDLRRKLAEDRTAGRAFAREIESIVKRAEQGILPPADELNAVKAAAATSKDPAVHAALADAEAELERARRFRGLSLPEMETTVQALRRREETEGATDREVARRKMAERMLSNAQGQLKSNPLAWDDKVGAIRLVPLDASSAETLAASGRVRAAQAEEVAKRHGLAKPVYLQPHEARSLAGQFAKGGEEGLQMAEAVLTAFGDNAPAVLDQIGRQGPTVARVATLLRDTGRSKGVLDAAEGLHLTSLPGYKRLAPERAKTRDIMISEAGGAFDGFEDELSAAAGVADLIYEKRAVAARATQFDDRVWRQAFKEALGEHKADGKTYGGVVRQGLWNANRIVLPGWLRQDGWRDAINMIEPADLEAAALGVPTGRDGKPVAMSRIKAGRFIQVGDGQFAVSLSGGDKPDVGRDGKREPFVIDLGALRDRLMVRRRDLFLGGQ